MISLASLYDTMNEGQVEAGTVIKIMYFGV
jgi:hypothetical protein